MFISIATKLKMFGLQASASKYISGVLQFTEVIGHNEIEIPESVLKAM